MVGFIHSDALYIGTDMCAEDAYREVVDFNETAAPSELYIEIGEFSYEPESPEQMENIFKAVDRTDDEITFMFLNSAEEKHSVWYHKDHVLGNGKKDNQVQLTGVKGYQNGLIHPEHLPEDVQELYENLI